MRHAVRRREEGRARRRTRGRKDSRFLDAAATDELHGKRLARRGVCHDAHLAELALSDLLAQRVVADALLLHTWRTAKGVCV